MEAPMLFAENPLTSEFSMDNELIMCEEINAMHTSCAADGYCYASGQSDSELESFNGPMTPISSQESPVQDQGSPQSYLMMETPVWDTHGQCTTNYDNVKCNGVDCFDRLDAQESSSWGKQAKATMTTMPNMMMGMTMGMTMDVGMTMGDASIDSLCDFDDDTLSSSSLVTTNSQAQPAMHKAPRAERASQAPRTTGVSSCKGSNIPLPFELLKREISRNPRSHNAAMERAIAKKQHKLKQAAKTPRGPKQKTPYTGVFYHVRSRKYDAAAWNRESKRQEYLGSFCNPEEAAVARDLFMIHLYSEINSAKTSESRKPEPKRKDIQKTLNQDLAKYPDHVKEKLKICSTKDVLKMLRDERGKWSYLVHDFEPCNRILKKASQRS